MSDSEDEHFTTTAKEVKSEVQQIVKALPKELRPSENFAAQVDKLLEQFDELQDNAISMFVAVRSSYSRGGLAVKRSLEATSKVSGTCDKIALSVTPLTADLNVVTKVVAALKIWGEAGILGGEFIQLKDEMTKVSDCFHTMLDVVFQFVGKLKGFKEGVQQLLEDVQDSLETCSTSVVMQIHRLFSCNRVQKSSIADRDFRMWPLQLIQQFEAKLATFQQFLVGLFKALEDLWERLTGRGQQVMDMHEEVQQKLDDLEEPPSGFFEVVASPFKKTYQAVDLVATFGGDMQQFMQMWGECNALSTEAERSLQQTHSKVDDFWVDLIDLGHEIMDYFGVESPGDLDDREVLDVEYDPVSRTFLTEVEQGITNFMRCGK